jgi:hypothetical protein|tara:strand:+ start:683 stop:874 length:192 start_codon:yes stop_codon:yes gene_type:complete
MTKRKVKSKLDAELQRMEFLGIIESHYELDGSLMYGLTEKGKSQQFDGKDNRKILNNFSLYQD